MRRTLSKICTCGALLFALAGCGNSGGNNTDGSQNHDMGGGNPDLSGGVDGSGPAPCDASATFTKVKSDVLSRCGGEACHLRRPTAGGLDLTAANAYKDLVNVTASANMNKVRVKPGDPDNSFLWQKLINQLTADEGSPMPKGLMGQWAKLSDANLNLVRCWIKNGAKDD